MSAYLATPATGGPWPGLVVLHEAFGLTEDIRSIADRFAARGYLALAPDLFSWGMSARCLVASFRSICRARAGRSTTSRPRDDVAALDGCNGQVGVIGFCMGGGFALLSRAARLFDASSSTTGWCPRTPSRCCAARARSSGATAGEIAG